MTIKNRFQDALYIQQGACNPSAIAHTLLAAIAEVREENETPTEDAACRLIAHQLSHIMKVDEIITAATCSSIAG